MPSALLANADAAPENYHVFGTLDGMLDGKSYITVSEMRNEHGQPIGYLSLCSSGEQLTQFKQQFWSNFLLSACVMLLCASILTKILTAPSGRRAGRGRELYAALLGKRMKRQHYIPFLLRQIVLSRKAGVLK